MVKTVLITGGAQRLGAVLSRCFAQAGWQVWCHYQHSGAAAEALRAELAEHGQPLYTVQADLADEAQRQQMMDHIVATTGPLHCLVNNASSFEPDTAKDFNIQAARQQLEVNLLAPMALTAAMARSIPADDTSGERSVIHVLDQKVFNLNPDYFSYTSSKLALERLVALQAQALAPQLRICGVAPGLMFVSGPQTQANFERASRINLLRRPIDPAQVAVSCLFLATNPCVTGITLTVDNGQHLLPLPRDVMFVVQDLQKGDA